jgi:hypothetical protein
MDVDDLTRVSCSAERAAAPTIVYLDVNGRQRLEEAEMQ